MMGLPPRHYLISTGNETFDKFLGGGLVSGSLNIFERQGHSSQLLDIVWNNSLAASTLASKMNLICVNFNTSIDLEVSTFISNLPTPRKVKSESSKNLGRNSEATKMKIAWRYSERGFNSPSDRSLTTDQVDFWLLLSKNKEPSELGRLKIINVKKDFTIKNLLSVLESETKELEKDDKVVNVIIMDLLHPFSPVIDNPQQLCQLIYTLRCFTRNISKGCVLLSYDIRMCTGHSDFKQHIYNSADCVVSFYTYETGENELTGYRDWDGTIEYVKVPKINSFGPHFQRDLSDWGYRFTKNSRFFVVDELSLPPHDDHDEKTRPKHSDPAIVEIEQTRRPLEHVSPLEDFKEGALLAKKL